MTHFHLGHCHPPSCLTRLQGTSIALVLECNWVLQQLMCTVMQNLGLQTIPVCLTAGLVLGSQGHPWNCWQLVPNSASYKVAFWVAITSARRMSELKAPIQRLLIQCSKRTRCSSDHTQLPSQVDWQFNMDLDIFLLEFCPKLHVSSRGQEASCSAC